jgi:hypothetical protein
MSEATEPAATAAEGVRRIPDVEELTVGQYAGWNCVWCGAAIPTGARLVGVSRGRDGAHVLDTPVYAGRCCP